MQPSGEMLDNLSQKWDGSRMHYFTIKGEPWVSVSRLVRVNWGLVRALNVWVPGKGWQDFETVYERGCCPVRLEAHVHHKGKKIPGRIGDASVLHQPTIPVGLFADEQPPVRYAYRVFIPQGKNAHLLKGE